MSYNFITESFYTLSLLIFLFFKVHFIDYAITVVPFFSPLYSPLPCTLLPTSIPPPPQFMSMGHACKFFGFSISYTILNPPYLFCTYQLCFLFSVPFPHSHTVPSPLITLHVISISVILFLLQLFAQFVLFFFHSGSVVDSCEFVVILLFIFFIFFLDKSL